MNIRINVSMVDHGVEGVSFCRYIKIFPYDRYVWAKNMTVLVSH